MLDATAVSGPPIEDKQLPMWHRPLAVNYTTSCILPILWTTSAVAFGSVGNNWPFRSFTTGGVQRSCLCVARFMLLATYLGIALTDAGLNVGIRGRPRPTCPSLTVEIDRVLRNLLSSHRFAMHDAGLQLAVHVQTRDHLAWLSGLLGILLEPWALGF